MPDFFQADSTGEWIRSAAPYVQARPNRRDWLKTVGTSGLLLSAAINPLGCVSNRQGASDNPEKPDRVWGRLGLADGRFQKPRAMTIDAQDNLYIVDKTGRIQVFDPEGNFLRRWNTPAIETGKPTGLGINRDGNIMVADTHYFRVLFYTPSGDLLEEQTIGGTHGPAIGQFAFVTDVIQDSQGNYYISEYGEFDRIQKYSAEGKFICRFGETGTGPLQFSRPQCLMLDRHDHLWVSDACNHRIQVIRCEQDRPQVIEIIGREGNGLGQFRFPYNLWLDGDDFFYVVEFGNHRVQKLTRNGKPIFAWGKAGRDAGELREPWAIVKDSRNRLHILDSGNHRVQRVAI